MKKELVSTEWEELTFTQLVKRSIIINSLITGTILSIMLFKLSQTSYMENARYVQLFDYGLIILSCGFVIYREDGLGLHDLFAHTRVILSSEKNKLFESKKEEVKEEIIEEVSNEPITIKRPKTTRAKKVRDAKVVKEKVKKEK